MLQGSEILKYSNGERILSDNGYKCSLVCPIILSQLGRCLTKLTISVGTICNCKISFKLVMIIAPASLLS